MKERRKGYDWRRARRAVLLEGAVGTLSHYRALRFGDPRNDGTRAYSLLVNAILRGHFGSLHPGHCQDVFHYLKTRCCVFCWCASYI